MINSLYDIFKHWSARGSVYIISDPHFGDSDCKYMDPNWPDPEEYLKKINSKVHKNDTLICLGDCGDLDYIARIKAGYKVLITGNHDDKGLSKYKKAGKEIFIEQIDELRAICELRDNHLFDEVYDGPLFIADRILLSHEPIYGLEEMCMNIHGHCHDWTGQKGHLCIAANIIGYEVLSLGELIKEGLLSNTKNYHRITIDKASN